MVIDRTQEDGPILDGSIQAVFFDAVGTLIHPQPSAVEVYTETGRRYGSRLESAEIARRFRHFFQREEEADVHAGLTTSEEREKQRWRRIVTGVLDDVADQAGCFAELFEHFSRPRAWRCDPATDEVLAALSRRGCRLGLASNYDARLRPLVENLTPLRWIEKVVISSEVGWRKPAPDFFAAVCRTAQLPPSAILFVGDDRDNDYEGALHHGLIAILLDPAEKHTSLGNRRLASLTQLTEL